jgi:uncharacterized protein (DUF1501 family)
MTFSEFGRRVAENASSGTDHGAAAPMFMIGSKIKAGLLGTSPSLAPADLFQGDLKFHVDFRSVYAGVLEGWLNTRSEPILGKRFEPCSLGYRPAILDSKLIREGNSQFELLGAVLVQTRGQKGKITGT